MMHSFLLIGQSNMAGRGYKDDVEPIVNDRIKLLRNGLWRGSYVPYNPDRSFAGISLAESFADLYQKEKDVDVGIIPCADGGTCLDQWRVGGQLFDHAIYMSELASRTSTIAGVLWHQGESDSGEEQYREYGEKLEVIMSAFREKLGLYDVPFLLGGLGDFLADNDYFNTGYFREVNKALKEYAHKTPMTGFVSAEGLTSNPDLLHFNAKSLREFGVRYYNEFLKLEDKNKVFEDKGGIDEIVTGIEHL